MQRFKRLGVFLHNSPSDEAALSYAGIFATLAQSEHVIAIHVREPDEDDSADPDPAAFAEETRRRLPDPVAKITEVEVHSGTGVGEILQCAQKFDLDMVVVGRRLPSDQLGIGADFARLARKAPCNVLIVPERVHTHLSRISVAVDFSPHSERALEQGLAIARGSGDAQPQVLVHTNAHVGYGYSKLGLNLHEAISERIAANTKKLEELVARMNTTGVKVAVTATASDDHAAAIHEVAVANKMDMIVVGSRGHGSIILLGSTAERILHQSLLPVLIVKQKGETVPVLEALFGAG
jgi:nucleotide-binding universal stress UspA family protein